MAAYKAGVKTVLIPSENVKDLEELDKSAKDGLNIIPCNTLDDVFKYAFSDEETVSQNAVLESMRSTPTYDIPQKPTRPTRSV